MRVPNSKPDTVQNIKTIQCEKYLEFFGIAVLKFNTLLREFIFILRTEHATMLL